MKVNYNKRIIIVISSPSGAGKTSVCHKLIERDKSIALSISDTTRSPRDNEIDGVDYNFIEEEEFKNKIKNTLRNYKQSLAKLDIDENLRPENLTVSNYCDLVKLIN